MNALWVAKRTAMEVDLSWKMDVCATIVQRSVANTKARIRLQQKE